MQPVRITRNEAERWMAPNAFAWIQPRVDDGYFIPLAERKSVSQWVSDVRRSKLKQPALLRPRSAMEFAMSQWRGECPAYILYTVL